MINLLWAAIGSLGFSLIFNVKKNKILYCIIAAFLNYAGYFITFNFTNNLFLSNIVGAFLVLLYSNIMALLLKCPSTIIMLPGLLPSVPGASLFYMMQNFVSGDNAIALDYGLEVCKVVIGIVFGVAIASVLFTTIKTFNKKIKGLI